MHPQPSIGLQSTQSTVWKLLTGKEEMAGSTRLELATSGVTGRRSNQLNYDPLDTADRRWQTADWQRRLTIADWNVDGRLAIGGDCHFAAILLSTLPLVSSLPSEAREANDGWWAVQDSNL